MFRSGNPALKAESFGRGNTLYVSDPSTTMTVGGTVAKTGVCLLLLLLTAGYTWMQFFKAGANPAAVSGYMMLGLFGGLITALVTVFKMEWCMYTAPLYALLEGFFIGGISSIFEAQYPGIAIQASGLTFGTLAVMLFIYQSGIIQVTDKFRMGVVAATGAVALFYFVAIILSFFGIVPSILYSSSLISIGFSLVVVGIAALNLVLDFDIVEQGVKRGAPKHMEWYGAFALMVTLVWLYIEMLRLLSKLRNR